MSSWKPLYNGSPRDKQSNVGENNNINSGQLPSKTGSSYSTFSPPVLCHAAMVLFYSLVLCYGYKLSLANIRILSLDGKIPAFGGAFKNLTHINLWLQLLFFSLQLVADLSPGRLNIQRASSFIFTTLAFPIAAEITIIFWIIYGIDRNLIFHEVYDDVFPWYMNHFWHTTILLWVLCEVYLVKHKFPSTVVAGITIFVFNSIYIGWLYSIYAATGYWVYAFLGYLSPLQQTIFFSLAMCLMFGLYFAGKKLSYLCWCPKGEKQN